MLYITEPRKGTLFIHKHMLEPSWVPGPGETWAMNAPKAAMEVTSVLQGTVYYKYAVDDSPNGKFRMDYEEFKKKYCETLDSSV